MKHEFQILGHCNTTLVMVIDALLANYPDDDVTITIVSNVRVDDPAPYGFSDSDNLRIMETDSTSWDARAPSPILGVINPHTKRIVYSHFLEVHGIRQEHYYTVIHPSAVIARQTSIGAGAFIGPGVVIAPYAAVGALTTINRNASVGHHTTVGRFCKINPGSNIAGRCRIGDYVTLGISSTVFDGKCIGNNSVISGGSLVTKSIPDNSLAAGSPARVVRDSNAWTGELG